MKLRLLLLSAIAVASFLSPASAEGLKTRTAGLFTPAPVPRMSDVLPAACGSGQKECRIGVSTWCCPSSKSCGNPIDGMCR
jgi:hypothetical protein